MTGALRWRGWNLATMAPRVRTVAVRHAVSCHLIENLGGPDAGNVGRRTDPQDFLLDLRQFLPAAFNRQVSTRNHHAQGPGIAHRREQQPGKVEKCSA